MKFFVFTFLLIIKIQRTYCQNLVQNPVQNPVQKPVQNLVQDHELQAVLTLSNQLHAALKNYISECNLVPVGNSCQKQTRQMKITKGQDLVNIIVWNQNAGIEKILSRHRVVHRGIFSQFSIMYLLFWPIWVVRAVREIFFIFTTFFIFS